MVNGSLHIVWYDPPGDIYGITYAPYQGPGGAVRERKVQGAAELREFLSALNVDQNIIEATLEALHRDRQHSIGNVMLSTEDIRSHGLE